MLCLGDARPVELMQRANLRSSAPNQGSSALWRRVSEHYNCKLSSTLKLQVQPEGSMAKGDRVLNME